LNLLDEIDRGYVFNLKHFLGWFNYFAKTNVVDLETDGLTPKFDA